MLTYATGTFAIASAILLSAIWPARSEPARCYENGDIITFDGVASRDNSDRGGARAAWVLNLSRPICVANRGSDLDRSETSAVGIIGTPPPMGVPLALTGKLLLGPSASDTRIFAALEVIRGRKLTQNEAALPNVLPPPRPSHLLPPPRPNNLQCDSPPYGGTQSEFQGFVHKFGHIVTPAKILAGVCNAKSGRASRAGLYRLGLTDTQIEAESTERLATDTIVALKKLVNTIE
ncbi:MAG TPA: hypothetical protein VHY79_13700 [Rhizomicrobium sp.]|jgi:hypothetical protein|nr:hypothetical protein [Rhizomicrobium sp.]